MDRFKKLALGTFGLLLVLASMGILTEAGLAPRIHIAHAENEEKKQLRLLLIIMTASVLRHAMHLLGIRLPEKM
jgi:hypothetical protein